MESELKDMLHLEKRLLENRTIICSQPVSDRLARRVTSMAIALQADDSRKPILVYINSPGGSADSGSAIYDILRFVTPPVKTIVTGLCASAAIDILLAADRENRFSLPTSRFLMHQPSTTVVGAAADIEITAREIIKLRDRHYEIVAAATGKSAEKVAADCDRDFWLSAEEARDYGLVGHIVTGFSDLGM